MHCWSAVEILFCVSIDWDLLQLFNKLFLADLNAWSWSKIPHPTNSLSCEEHAIPFFWTNLEMFFVSLAKTRCSISVPTFQNRSSAKKVYNSCHGFAWLLSMGSNILSTAASPCDRTRDWSEMSFVPCPRVEHVLLQFVLHFWVEYNT